MRSCKKPGTAPGFLYFFLYNVHQGQSLVYFVFFLYNVHQGQSPVFTLTKRWSSGICIAVYQLAIAGIDVFLNFS